MISPKKEKPTILKCFHRVKNCTLDFVYGDLGRHPPQLCQILYYIVIYNDHFQNKP